MRQTLADLPAAGGPPRVSVVGIGHYLRGDDAAGLVIVRLLKGRLHARTQIIEAGPAPENCCGLVLRHQPDLILFIDAANMGEAVGALRLLDWKDVLVGGGESHRFSLRVLAQYLAHEAGCPVRLLGIQPQSTMICDSLSPGVASAVARTVSDLAGILSVGEVLTHESPDYI